MKTRIVISGILSFCLSSMAFAESEVTPQTNGYTTRHTFYLGVGELNIDKQIAHNEGVGSTPTYVRLGWEGQKHNGIFAAGMSVFMYSDRESFSQDTRSNYGRYATEKSSAEAVNLYGEGGYSFQATPNIYFDAVAGYELVLQSERSIAYCSNCYSEDIDIDSGLYLTPRMKVIADNGFTFLLSYHKYLSGDVNNGLSIGLGYSY